MGAAIGTTAGVVFAGIPVIMDPKLKGKRLGTLSSTCLQYGVMFGLFLSVGSLIHGC